MIQKSEQDNIPDSSTAIRGAPGFLGKMQVMLSLESAWFKRQLNPYKAFHASPPPMSMGSKMPKDNSKCSAL